MRHTLRVATFNIRYDTPSDGAHSWTQRRSAVRQTIDDLRCDVVGLQEVLPRQRRYLRARTRGLRWYGVGRDDGRRNGEQCPVLVRRRSVRVEEWSTQWLSATPDVAGSTGIDARIPRVATVVRGRWAGRQIGVINTHFDHRGERSRVAAARQIAQLVSVDDARNWVVCGDFNIGLDEDPMQILAANGLRSVLPPEAAGTFHAFGGAADGPRIDHVLVSSRWRIERAEIELNRPGGMIPSDHWPVLAELTLGEH